MCGIFGYLSSSSLSDDTIQLLQKESGKIKHRGPDDNSTFRSSNVFLSFYRLAINDLSINGNQPLYYNNLRECVLICNGEIYNWKKLSMDYGYDLKSTSDCEVILHLYKQFGFKKAIEMLDGVFSCILIDGDNIHVARDPIGVRPLFIGKHNEDIMFSSEMKSIQVLADSVEQFPPGCIWNNNDKEYVKYYVPSLIYNQNKHSSEVIILQTISDLFISAVDKRLMSERPIGCMLSGGLDSSLVAALLVRNIKGLRTFSIGLKGASDLKFAKRVADHLGTIHTEIIVTEQEMLDAIDPVILQIESYDTTTVRASTPMYLLGKYIKEHTDITVIYSGEGSDEASGSYLYFRNAPDTTEFHNETIRLMEDLSYYDVLRCDRTTAGHSLEVRVPFLDKDFLQYYMNIDPKLKIPSTYGGIEKYLLRKAFDKCNLLPDDILWRTKEAMSDGVSCQERSWYEIIQEHTEPIYSDTTMNKLQIKYTHNTPILKESMHYRIIFDKYYPGREKIIPYYWLPKWCGNKVDPSARILKDVYSTT